MIKRLLLFAALLALPLLAGGRPVLVSQDPGTCCTSAPTYEGSGARSTAATAITPSLGTAGSGDLIIGACASSASGLDASGGATYVTVGSVTNSVTTTIFCRVATGTDTLTTNDAGSWQSCRVHAYTTGTYSGDCTGVLIATSSDTSTASLTLAGPTTTSTNSAILGVSASENDDATNTESAAKYSAQTNANLASITERADACWITGTDGCQMAFTATMATAAAVGNTTATRATSDTSAHAVIAIKGIP